MMAPEYVEKSATTSSIDRVNVQSSDTSRTSTKGPSASKSPRHPRVRVRGAFTQGRQFRHPGNVATEAVPENVERAVIAQYAGHLVGGVGLLEPVPRRRGEDRVKVTLVDGDLFRSSVEYVHVGAFTQESLC